jgi:hypothetical protein
MPGYAQGVGEEGADQAEDRLGIVLNEIEYLSQSLEMSEERQTRPQCI